MAHFPHTSLIIESDDTLRERLAPIVERSVVGRQPMLMVVSERTERVIRSALGVTASRVAWGDPRSFYRGLGSAYETFRRYLARQHRAGRQVHVVAEPSFSAVQLPPEVNRAAAYLSYESICNRVYASYGCPVTCVWDQRAHPPDVIDDVRDVHPFQIGANGQAPNPAFVPPESYLAGREGGIEPPPEVVDLDLRPGVDLSALRAALHNWALGAGFDAAAASDVVVASSEVAANAHMHGAAPVTIRCWRREGTLVIQVDDGGGVAIPSDAGYMPPSNSAQGGRGLWLARQMADVMVTATQPGRTTVRLYFPRGITPALSGGDGDDDPLKL